MYTKGMRIYSTRDVVGYDNEGICAALALAYCADFLAGKRGIATQRTGKNLDVLKSYFRESLAYQQARSEQVKRNRAKGENIPEQDDAFTYQDEHLGQILKVKAVSRGTYPAKGLFDYAPPLNTVWYVSHDQKLEGDGGHAIAISTGSQATDLCVLDPNHGLYQYSQKEDYTYDLKVVFAMYLFKKWGRAVMARG